MIMLVMKAYTTKWQFKSGFIASMVSKTIEDLFTAYCFIKTSTLIYHVNMYYSIYQFREKQMLW